MLAARGGWADLRGALRQLERRRVGRRPDPSAGRVESQGIKPATQGSEVGFDGGKKLKGRNRHLLGDTLGLILAVVVTAADREGRLGWVALLTPDFAAGVKRLRNLWVDGGYRAAGRAIWGRNLKSPHQIDREITGKDGKGFPVIPWRWTVERTFAWLLPDRRHSRDYAVLTAKSEAMIQISLIRLLLNRLA